MSEVMSIQILFISKLTCTTDEQWELVESVLEEECSVLNNLKLIKGEWYYKIEYILSEDDMARIFPYINYIMSKLANKVQLNKDVEISVRYDIQTKLAKYYYMKGKSESKELETVRGEEPDSYDLIKHLRKAQVEFFDKHNLEGMYWEVDLHVKELSSCEKREVLKNIYDEDRK